MILAVDIGTTSVKAALFDRAGNCAASDSEPVRQLRSADPLEHEVRAESWTAALAVVASRLAAASPASAVECVAVSGNGPSLVPVDRNGKALHPAITWMDRRAVEEAALAGAAAGRFLDPTYNLPKALWFRRQRPGIYRRTARFASCPEYVGGILTGVWRTVLPAEGFQPIIWNDASIDALGLDRDKFPPYVKPGAILGGILPDAAAATGLPAGIPVVLCGPDFAVSLVGTATTRPGRACDRAGTSEGINLCHSGAFPEDGRLLVMPHVVEPHRNISGVISTSGKAVSWFRSAMGEDERDYEGFFERICDVPPGARRLVFLPYLTGERAPIWDTEARGAFVGLTLNHGKNDMARAVVESTAFAMRDVVETMESLGARVTELRVTGTPGRNPVWNQIKADITGRPLLVPRFAQAELLGDLCVALAALGDYPDPAQAAERLVVMGRVHTPDPGLAELYDGLFRVYRESYQALAHVFPGLSAIRAERPKE